MHSLFSVLHNLHNNTNNPTTIQHTVLSVAMLFPAIDLFKNMLGLLQLFVNFCFCYSSSYMHALKL